MSIVCIDKEIEVNKILSDSHGFAFKNKLNGRYSRRAMKNDPLPVTIVRIYIYIYIYNCYSCNYNNKKFRNVITI